MEVESLKAASAHYKSSFPSTRLLHFCNFYVLLWIKIFKMWKNSEESHHHHFHFNKMGQCYSLPRLSRIFGLTAWSGSLWFLPSLITMTAVNQESLQWSRISPIEKTKMKCWPCCCVKKVRLCFRTPSASIWAPQRVWKTVSSAFEVKTATPFFCWEVQKRGKKCLLFRWFSVELSTCCSPRICLGLNHWYFQFKST